MAAMFKAVLFAATVGLSLIYQARAEELVPVSTTSAPYQSFVQWSNIVSNNGQPTLLEWGITQLKKDFPEDAALLNSLRLSWEGTRDSRECADVRQLAHVVVVPSSNTAEIRFCLRTFMFAGDFERMQGTSFIFNMWNTGPAQRRHIFEDLEGYLKYIASIADKDDLSSAPYGTYCTPEYYLYLRGTHSNFDGKCEWAGDMAEVDRLRTWYSGAAGHSSDMARLLKATGREESVSQALRDYYLENFKSSPAPLIYSVLLHEVGHIKKCHHGSVGSYVCANSNSRTTQPRKESATTLELQQELEADEYALSKLQVAWKAGDALDEYHYKALQWLFTHRVMVGMLKPKVENQLQSRLELQAEAYKIINNRAVAALKDALPSDPYVRRAFESILDMY